MRRFSRLTGPERATAMKVAIRSQPIGLRSRYMTYSVRTTVTTTRTACTTVRTAPLTARRLATGPDARRAGRAGLVVGAAGYLVAARVESRGGRPGAPARARGAHGAPVRLGRREPQEGVPRGGVH